MAQRNKHYVIPIKPIAWKRAGVSNMRFYDQQVSEKIALGVFLLQQHGNAPMFEGPISLEIIFYMSKPQGKKKVSSHYHKNIPDLSNLIKLIEDAIVDTKCIIADDRTIAKIIASKIYDDRPRTEFTIRELE